MVVLSIIGILLLLGLPLARTARTNALSRQLTNNIRIINSGFCQYAVSENLDSADNVTLSEINDYIEGGLGRLTWPVDAPDNTETRNTLSIEYNGKTFTCDHPEGI